VTKFLNKWFRKIHRWLAVPTAILIPVALAAKFAGSNPSIAVPRQLEQIQSLLVLTLAVTGTYLFLLPYIVKWQRKRRQRKATSAPEE
jgi:uncharacterized iron-regulated membrane protein